MLDPLTCAQETTEPVEPVFTYTTTGGWVVTANAHTITLTNPGATDKIESWGDGPHENLNGKHIKDWLQGTPARRTILLPDGTIVTLRTCSASVTAFVSIFDGEHTRRLAAQSNRVIFASDDPADALALEAVEADGEAARAFMNENDGLSYENVHTQEVAPDGTPGQKVPGVQLLGETGGPENPNYIRDYFDDPRLGHT